MAPLQHLDPGDSERPGLEGTFIVVLIQFSPEDLPDDLAEVVRRMQITRRGQQVSPQRSLDFHVVFEKLFAFHTFGL